MRVKRVKVRARESECEGDGGAECEGVSARINAREDEEESVCGIHRAAR